MTRRFTDPIRYPSSQDAILTAASLCTATYGYAGFPVVQWDHEIASDSYRICLKRANGVWYAAHEGTFSVFQWLEDLDAIKENEWGIGEVNQGMNAGLDRAYVELSATIGGDPWVACGHSRGAAQCTLTAARGIHGGHPPLFRVAFGEPLSTCGDASRLVAEVPSFSFCNAWKGNRDPVVSIAEGLLSAVGYTRVNQLTILDAAPSAQNPWLDYPDDGALHWMPDYERNVHRLAGLDALRILPASKRIDGKPE